MPKARHKTKANLSREVNAEAVRLKKAAQVLIAISGDRDTDIEDVRGLYFYLRKKVSEEMDHAELITTSISDELVGVRGINAMGIEELACAIVDELDLVNQTDRLPILINMKLALMKEDRR